MEHFEWISASIIIIISCAISMMILADVHWRTLTKKKQLTVLIYFIERSRKLYKSHISALFLLFFFLVHLMFLCIF